MAVNPINVSRISQNMRTNFLLESLQRNQLEVFTTQARISTGRRFVTPSEDPVGAARVMDLTQALGQQEQFVANLRHADDSLAAADTAITEINSLLNEADAIASQNVSNLTDAAQRLADAELILGIRRQLMSVGNRLFDGRYIFAGRDTTLRPFIDALGGVAFIGDTGDLVTRIEEGVTAVVNVPGNVLFGALSSRIAADADLTPALTASTRTDDLRGVTPELIRYGTLVFNEIGGAGTFRVNLSSADTIGDIVALINEAAVEAGASFSASLTADGLEITPGALEVSITDTSAGAVAAQLGILTNTPTGDVIVGQTLAPRLTRLTPVEDLARGAGVDLENGLVITNGAETVTVDLSTATTVQDIINAINNAGVNVLARINEAGTGIDVFNQVSGTSLTIGENGGTTAADLGIRTLNGATLLDELNFQRGFETKEGEDDLRITAKNGSTVDVNLDGAVTVADVIDIINTATADAGVSISASLASLGNGIRIVDGTGGAGDLSVTPLNSSHAATDLALVKTVTGEETELLSDDTNPMRTDGILSALVELEEALRRDDTQDITLAAERLEAFMPEVTRIHGVVGARSQAMRAKLDQTQDAAQTTQVFLSEVRDLDYTEAVTKMESALTQLQASLRTSSIVSNLSLLDFLS
jgi:flagellar hook-associated protein 3 FlgL